MRQQSLLGRDNNAGLKHSVTAREKMEAQSNAKQYPMPEVRSKMGLAFEKDRLAELEEAVRRAEYERAVRRKWFEETPVEASETIHQTQKEPAVVHPKSSHPKVGFDHRESWFGWFKRVIFRS